jgi:LPS sulfotransferase NodH
MSDWDTIRAAVDAAEKDTNAAEDGLQAKLAAAQGQAIADAATIATLRAQVLALTPKPTIQWGSSVMPVGSETYPQALARVDKALTPDVIRFFCTGAPKWPTQTGTHPLVISFKYPPAEVVAGKHDTELAAFFAATPRPSVWSYWHEPEDDVQNGKFTAAEYRAAWAHIAPIARASGKPLRSALILMEFTLRAPGRNWKDYFVPDAVDVLAWDAYWRPGRTAADVYSRPRAVSVSVGKPWAVCETGVSAVEQPDPVQRQAMLTALAKDLVAGRPQPEWVTYFDSDPGGTMKWQVSTDPAAAAAWKAGRAV